MRLSTLILFALVGCSPTFAPPIRAFQYGAPARLTEGRVEIGGSAGGLAVPSVGGPHIAVGIRDWLAIEGGANLQLLGDGEERWAMGFVGPRISFAPQRRDPLHLIADIELGLGAGVGGVINGGDAPGSECEFCDNLKWTDRFAFGGYQGFGLGGQIHWFSIYLRARLEESTATHIPTTLWPSVSLGLEANIAKRVALTAAGGYMGYTNTRDTINAWFYQVGVAVFFDAFPRHDAPAVAPTPPPPPPPPEPPPAPPIGGDWDEPQPDEE